MTDETPTVASYRGKVDLGDLPALVELMTKAKVLKLKTPNFELELHPLAFSAEVPGKGDAFGAGAGEEKCNCGHTLTAHSEHGLCLEGCNADACGMEPARNP